MVIELEKAKEPEPVEFHTLEPGSVFAFTPENPLDAFHVTDHEKAHAIHLQSGEFTQMKDSDLVYVVAAKVVIGGYL